MRPFPGVSELVRVPTGCRSWLLIPRRAGTQDFGHAAQYALILIEYFSDIEAAVADAEFTKSIFVPAGSFLHHGYRAAYFSPYFKIPQHNDRICEIGNINRRPHLSHHAVLSNSQKCRCALSV